MKNFQRKSFYLVALMMMTAFGSASALEIQDLKDKSVDAAQALEASMSIPENAIPESLLKRAQCVAVYPDVYKLSFFGGYETGKGLVSCRTGGFAWSAPIFTNIKGLSFGFQWGVKKTDIVLVFVDKSAAEDVANQNFSLGVDASVAAGPIGRDLKIGVDYKLDNAVYTYSNAKGLFLGVALDGAALVPYKKANVLLYSTNDRQELESILTLTDTIKSDITFDFVDSLYLHAN
jgi:lipid-binding SYLF domain-containing protein